LSASEGGTIVTFPSVHYALAAEKAMKAVGLLPVLIPVPRGISSDCGFCLFFEAGAEGAKAQEALPALLSSIVYEDLYRVSLVEIPGRQRKEKQYEREHYPY
jgi:hypothetical protein